MLKLRIVMWDSVDYSIGNSKLTYLWWDKWHPHGALIKRYGQEITVGTGLPLNATVANVIGDYWVWPPSRSNVMADIHSAICGTIFLSQDVEDCITCREAVDRGFSCRSA
jgi:hypothetical protein